MIQSFLLSLTSSASNDAVASRRRHPRREADRCVVVVCGQTFPVMNWSPGGLMLSGDDRLFGTGQDVDLTLKFKLRNAILDIDLRAQVLRKGQQKVVLQFEPLSRTLRRALQQVIDDTVAGEFANSQVPV